MSKPVAALPADLLLLLNDLEHVLSFNGLKGNQHARYIADEIQAKAEIRDAQDQGKLDQHTRSRNRANELLLKHEAYEMCFDAFFQSCTMHQPSYQAAFQQKLWQHVMQLLEEWQDLHEQQQMQMKSLALDHLHFKHDHKALQAKLKTLKLTVQTLLSDVSALLHHATSKDSSAAALPALPIAQGTSSSSSNNNSNASSRSSGSWQLQLQQSSSLPNVPARRSSDIVNSLIKSIEKMTRQFAECQSGRLAAAADSRAAPASKQQHSGTNDGEQAAASSRSSRSQSKGDAVPGFAVPAARPRGGQLQQDSTKSSSSSSAEPSRLAGGQLTRQVENAAHLGTKPKTGMPPLAPTELLGKHTSGDQQVADSPVRQKGRNMITAKSLSGCVAKRHVQHALAGASPHRSHPPSAFDSTLAWFMQNAESSSSSNSGTINGRHDAISEEQAQAAAAADITPGKGASECQSAAGSISQPKISTADVKSAGAATTQAVVLPAFSQSSLSSAGKEAAEPAPAQEPKQDAAVPSLLPALAASTAESAVTPVAEAATTPVLTATNGAHFKQQQPEWIATLMQQPGALQKVRAAVRFALSPCELELEPSVAEWASEAGPAATVVSAAAAAAEEGAAGSGPADEGKAAAHSAQARWEGRSSAVAAAAAPATSSASNNSGGGCSTTNSSSSQKRRSMHAAGELSLMNAAAAVAEQQGHSLSTASRAGRPGYALASATDLQLQQMPNASRFTHLQQQQQQHALVQVRSGSADTASTPGLQLQSTASSINTKRPASSHEARSEVGMNYGNSSSSSHTATATMMARSRSVGAGFRPFSLAGGAAAGPLTAALKRQTSLQKHPPAPARPAGPFRQKVGAAAAAGANLPVALPAAQRQAAGSTAEHSRLGGIAGAAAKHRPLSGHGQWGTAVGGGEGAAVAAGAVPATPAEDKGGYSAAPWSRDRNVHEPAEQQQQGSSQRLPRKQDLQQQHMAAVPEGQIADAVEGPPSDAMRAAANKAFSMASSSVGSDMVRLGSCNAGFWTHGSAFNNGSSSPPGQSTASQTNSPLVAAAGEAAATTLIVAAANACGVAALLSSEPAATVVGVQQTLMSQSKQRAPNQALVAPAVNKRTAQTVQQVAPQLEKSVSQQPASAAVPADGVGASAADTPADHNLAAADGNAYTTTAVELASTRQQQRQQQQHSQAAAKGSNSHSLAAAELKAEGSTARAAAYSGLITAAAAAASASEDTNQPAAAAAAATSGDPAAPTVPAGEHVTENVQELPDVIKSAQHCDSPRKQPRSKTVAVAAAAAAQPSAGAISTAEQWTSTASEAPSGSTAAADVARQAGQGSAAASAAAAAARVAPSMSASGDKRALQRSRNGFSSSVQARRIDDWAVRAMQSGPAASSSSPDDNSPLPPLCKRLRSSLVLLDTALSVLTAHERTTSDRCSHTGNGAAAAVVSATDEVHCAGVPHAGLVARHHQSPCTATSEVSHTQELLQPQQQQADRMAQQQPPQQLQHTVRASGYKLSEDGGRDVGLVRDLDKSADSSKPLASSTTAGNATRTAHNGTNTAAADSSHRALKCSSSSSSRLEASCVAVKEEPVAAAKSVTAAVAAAESVASSTDSGVASSADSSDITSTATGRLADLAGAAVAASAVAASAVAASAPAAAPAATTEADPEQLQVVPEASSSTASPDAAATLAAAGNDTLAHQATPACSGVGVQAVPAAAAAETTCAVATCTPPPQLPDKCASMASSSLGLAGPAVLCPSPALAGALGGNTAQKVADEAAAADGACDGDLSFSLDELVAILIDVMNSKQEQDDRLSAAGLLCHTPTAFLQRYLAAKVHGDREAYSNALNALLSGLDAHKQNQPEVAVFCRILAGDVEEHYFDRHMNFRSQLQHLLMQACEQSGPQQQQQQQQQRSSDQQQQAVASWAACSGMQLQQQQLLWLLDAWSRQRAEALAPDGNVTVQQLQETQREWWAFIRQHCCSSDLLADSVVSALLLWELQQHVVCLQTTVEAFRAADQQHSGLLDLEQFRVFCSELNDSMSNEELLMLWAELDKLGHGAVTFSTICSCLLPAMNEA